MNIVYLHAHDLGRYCEPMGYAIPAPNLMRLTREGTLFRQFHSCAPSCAPSRAALVTGQHPHCCGMLGLPSETLGYRLNDYSRHLGAFLKRHGYEAALSGVQHVARAPWADPEEVLPYDRWLNYTDTGHRPFDPARTASAAVEYLAEDHEKPFFLSVGFLEPHRDNRSDRRVFTESVPLPEPEQAGDDARYCLPWPHMPDHPITRREMANFKMGVDYLDQDVGRVLRALDTPERREDTLVIFTTDHGPGVCEMKCTLTDRGTGVATIVRGPRDPAYARAGLFNGGKVVDGMAQHLDLYPTLCDLLGLNPPDDLHGTSLMPLVENGAAEIHDAIFTEQTYHHDDTPRPLRAVRTPRYKYIRCWGPDQPHGVDTGPAENFWVLHGYRERPYPEEALYDLLFDPHETHNLAGDPECAEALSEMQKRLKGWMTSTHDPLLEGIPEPPAKTRQ